MAVLYITEYRSISVIGGQHILAPSTGPITEQSVPISGSNAASAAVSAQTNLLLINCDTACSLAFNKAAVNTAHRLAQNETRFYVCTPGDVINVISNT